MHDPALPLSRALQSHWRMKVCLGALLMGLYVSGYFYLNHHPSGPPARFALTGLDRWIGFSPGWVWVYLSVYLMLPVGLLASTREELVRYSLGMAGLLIAGYGCFYLWPVAGPRPLVIPAGGLYGWVVKVDQPLNSFPSLHLAAATYSACIGIQLTGGMLQRVFRIVLPAWVVLIGYSTLATKQHYLVDIPPGVVLGWFAWQCAWGKDTAEA
jgi:membrane-associated phospholipid phosphatase